MQRRHRHFKSGQIKDHSCTVHRGVGDHRSATTSKKEAYLAEKNVHNVLLSKRLFQKQERQGLVGSLRNRPTCRARLRSRTTASSGMRHIASSCTSYTHDCVFSNTWVSIQSENETNDPLKSGQAKAGPAGRRRRLWYVTKLEDLVLIVTPCHSEWQPVM